MGRKVPEIGLRPSGYGDRATHLKLMSDTSQNDRDSQQYKGMKNPDKNVQLNWEMFSRYYNQYMTLVFSENPVEHYAVNLAWLYKILKLIAEGKISNERDFKEINTNKIFMRAYFSYGELIKDKHVQIEQLTEEIGGVHLLEFRRRKQARARKKTKTTI